MYYLVELLPTGLKVLDVDDNYHDAVIGVVVMRHFHPDRSFYVVKDNQIIY